MTFIGGGLLSRATNEEESVKGSDDFNFKEDVPFVKRINETTSFHDNQQIRLICEWHEKTPMNKKDFLTEENDN